jgi:hypothetical protein
MISAVLLQIAFFARGLDTLCDLDAPDGAELLELRSEPVLCLLGQKCDLSVLGHGELLRKTLHWVVSSAGLSNAGLTNIDAPTYPSGRIAIA